MQLLKISILLLTSTCSLFAAEQVSSSHNLNIETGLSNNYIRSIFKDSQGLMWIGTDTGLDSYDGLQITTYAKRFKTPLKGAVQSISEFKAGVLIIGTSWGAFEYTINKNQITPIDFGLPSIDVRFVYKSSKEIIFIATDKGLFTLDKKTLKTKAFPLKGRSTLSLTAIVEDRETNLWVAGTDGLYKIRPDNSVVQQTNVYPVGQNINVIKLIDNTLYLGTIRGLFAYDIQSQLIKPIMGLEDISILSLTTDNQRKLYIGTDNAGVFILANKTGNPELISYNQLPAERLSSNTINALYYDKSNMLWIGTFDGGIDYRNMQKFKKFNTLEFPGTINANIRSIYFTAQGDKYIGTRDGSLVWVDALNRIKTTINSTHGNIFRSKILTTIYPFPGKPDLLLIGTFGGGITVFNKKTLACSSFSTAKVFQYGTTYKFCTDSQDQLWMATLDGLYRYNTTNQSLTRYNVAAVTGSNEVFTLHADAKDKIWIGTKTGVCYYSLSDKKFVQPKVCKPYRYQCTATFVDKKGNSWFCFNKGGVLMLDPYLNEKLWLTTEISLPENAPSSLVEDKEGNVWIGSSKGLFKVNKRNEIQAYGIEDGLTGLGICPESAILDSNGNLWWSNEKGLVTFINDKSTINNQPPTLKLTDLFINGKRYDADTLSYITKTAQAAYAINIKGKSNNNLEFRVVALNYKNARRNQYSFLLEGVDNDWTKPGTNPIVAYRELHPGTYVLKIKASNNDGVWTATPTEIKFAISPYFYETVWFMVLIGLLIGGVVLYFTRTYIVRMKLKIVTQIEDLRRKQGSTATLKITEKKGTEIQEKLLGYMISEKPFLNMELRQADVATAIGYTVHEISQVLNVQMNQNFSDFVNSYRVEEVKIRMRSDDAKKYTLTAIAMQCGFSAKSSFLRAFKKNTNMTPTEYFKGMKVE